MHTKNSITAKNSETIWAEVSKYTHERSAACFHIFIVFFLYFFFLDKQARRDQLTSSSFPYSSFSILEIKNRDHNSYGRTLKNILRKLIFCARNLGEIFAALFSRKYNQFEMCDIQFVKKQFVTGILKSLQAICKKAFHITWEKKSFHFRIFRKYSENNLKWRA